MSNNNSPFRIEILDANNNIVSGVGGPIVSCITLNDTNKLDTIGNLEFTMPASDRKAKFITTGTKFKIYDEIDGFLGTYLFASKDIQDRGGNSVLRVQCYNSLKELTHLSVGTNRNYVNETVENVIDELLAITTGWVSDVTEVSTTTISYSFESILRAIDELRDRKGVHYRLNAIGGNNVLEFGPFGDLSTLYFDQHNGQITADFLQATKNIIVTGASIVEESDEIFNKIIPLGFGQGVSQLTIEEASLGSYTTQTGTNKDGSSYYYIEDATSVTNYGRKERILSLPNVRPITNSAANVVNAANALKLTAEAYIAKHLEPRLEYEISCIGLREELKPGDKIHIRYNQDVGGRNYININDDFWVMDITRNRNANGFRTQTINIANVDDRRTTDTDVIIDVVRDLRDIGVHIPATLAYSPIGPYTKRIKGSNVANDRINPIFYVRIEEEVLYLNRALLRFRTSPLKSSVTTTASGGLHRHRMFRHISTGPPVANNVDYIAKNSAAGSGDITLQIDLVGGGTGDVFTYDADGTHTHDMSYGIFENTGVYPQFIGILINGSDYTSDLGGGWALTGSEEINVEVDITDILINEGLRQIHEIEFYATLPSTGEIEFECDLLVTIQPIIVT